MLTGHPASGICDSNAQAEMQVSRHVRIQLKMVAMRARGAPVRRWPPLSGPV